MPAITTLRSLLSPMKDGEVVRLVGSLFPRGYVSIIAGQPGCGKTWFELQYSLNVAKGGHCIGAPEGEFFPGRVLLLVGETTTDMMNKRAYQLGALSRVDDVIMYSLQSFSEHNIDVSLTTSYGRKVLSSLIDDECPDIVFIDSFISFMSGDESSQADISGSLVALNNIAKHKDIAIVIIHHYRKRVSGAVGARGMDDVIGSSAITRLAGVVVALEVDGMKSPPLVTARCVKSWWKPFKTFTFSICNPDATSERVEIVENYSVSASGLYVGLPSKDKIEKYILSLPGEFTQRQVVAATGCSVGSVNTVIGELLSIGRIVLWGKRGKEHLYTIADIPLS